MAWRNMIYKEGYAETTIGDRRRHSTTSELEQVGRYVRNTIFETSRESKTINPKRNGDTLKGHRLMVELLPKSASFGRQGKTV